MQRQNRDISARPSHIEVYGWEIAAQPVSIRMPIQVVQRLTSDIARGLNMRTPSHASGVLVGRIKSENGSTIIIEDYQLAAYSGERAGPAVGRDERVQEMVRRWKHSGGSRCVVGFFRSQRHGQLIVDAEELKEAKRLLPRSHTVFLVVRSSMDRAWTGRFFLRRPKAVTMEEEYGEFPFDADELLVRFGAADARPGKSARRFKTESDRLQILGPLGDELRPSLAPAMEERSLWVRLVAFAMEAARSLKTVAGNLRSIPSRWLSCRDRLTRVIDRLASRAERPVLTAENAGLSEPVAPVDLPATGERPWWQKPVHAVARLRLHLSLESASAEWRGLRSKVSRLVSKLRPQRASEAAGYTLESTVAEPESPVAEELQSTSKQSVRAKLAALVSKLRPQPMSEPAGYALESTVAEPQSPVAEELQSTEKQSVGAKLAALVSKLRPQRASELAGSTGLPATRAPLPANQLRRAAAKEPELLLAPRSLAWRTWLYIAASWTLAVGVTAWSINGLSLFPLHRADSSERHAVVTSARLGLAVKRNGELLDIVWDRNSDMAINSQGGYMIIRDGDRTTQVRLGPDEIRIAHISYGPRNADLSIRLEVVGEDGRTSTELVRVLNAREVLRRARNEGQ